MRYLSVGFIAAILVVSVGCNQFDSQPSEALPLAQVDASAAEVALLSFFRSSNIGGSEIASLTEGKIVSLGDDRYAFVAGAESDTGYACGVGVTFNAFQGAHRVQVTDGTQTYYMYDPIHFRCTGPCNCEMVWDLTDNTASCNCTNGANDCTLSICTGEDCGGGGPGEQEG